MQLKITWPYIVAFIALNMVMGELHEQAHILTGRLVCGCYGIRDFNVWATCEQCANPSWSILATVAGPLFSCSLMWLGAIWFSKSNNHSKQALGFSLVFANLPFARIFTALIGGGDEKVVVNYFLGDGYPSMVAKIIASITVLLVCLPPVIMVFKNLSNKNRGWIIAGFMVIPLIYGMFYHHMFLNSLLQKGIASTTTVLGTPDLVLYHFMLMLFILFFTRKKVTGAFISPVLFSIADKK